jgi:cytidine deaminase
MGELAPLPATLTARRLEARLQGPGSEALIEAEELSALAEETGLSEHEAILACLRWARRWARPVVSRFEVGAAARGGSGRLYLGANIEFDGLPLSQTVHAEQAAIAQAWAHGESELRELATSAAPCGLCRQFMLELPDPKPTLLLAEHGTTSLAELLPVSFGPEQLDHEPQLLVAGPHAIALVDADAALDPLVTAALDGAIRSSAPYTGSLAAVALATGDERRAVGSLAESVAFNPTLAPMQAAMIVLHHGGGRLEDIREAVLVELEGSPVSQLAGAREVLASVSPEATLRRVLAESTGPAA